MGLYGFKLGVGNVAKISYRDFSHKESAYMKVVGFCLRLLVGSGCSVWSFSSLAFRILFGNPSIQAGQEANNGMNIHAISL